MDSSNQHNFIKTKSKGEMPVVGIRVPSWASFTRPIFRGIVDFIRNNEKWQLQTLVDSTNEMAPVLIDENWSCLLYTSPSPRDRTRSRMPSSA